MTRSISSLSLGIRLPCLGDVERDHDLVDSPGTVAAQLGHEDEGFEGDGTEEGWGPAGGDWGGAGRAEHEHRGPSAGDDRGRGGDRLGRPQRLPGGVTNFRRWTIWPWGLGSIDDLERLVVEVVVTIDSGEEAGGPPLAGPGLLLRVGDWSPGEDHGQLFVWTEDSPDRQLTGGEAIEDSPDRQLAGGEAGEGVEGLMDHRRSSGGGGGCCGRPDWSGRGREVLRGQSGERVDDGSWRGLEGLL